MEDLNMCFACGKDNPIGFKLVFREVGENKVMAIFTPEEFHQGYPEVMHGGLITTLLDEAMAKVINFRGIQAVTATLEVKFRNPVPIGRELKIFGELVEEKKRRCGMKAWVEDEEGNILAEASAVFIKL
ncbi:PaaI family thioesterase [Anoxybacter fermentans]|nr:PaaI family thioesterase [Anoxybacter fermentans]